MSRFPLQKYLSRLGAGNLLIFLSYVTFISLGLPDGLSGVAWPSIRYDFFQSLDSLGILLVATTTGYLISSFYSGMLYSRLGMGWLLALSCGATGAGLIGYTIIPSWWMMVPLAAVAGLGAGAIDAGMNTYAASNFGERVMQWLHASYGIGITLGPLIMTVSINVFSSWRLGYLLVGAVQIILAICFSLSGSIWEKENKLSVKNDSASGLKISIKETLTNIKVWISIALFFIYTGIEATIGIWAYTLLTESRHIPPDIAGMLVGSYWATFTIGRIAAGFITKRIPIKRLIVLSLLMAFAGAVLLIWNPFHLSSLVSVSILGLAIAPVFPGMVSLTGLRVGERYMANTVGMQISAAGLGVAVIPALTGIIAARTSLEIIPVSILFWIILLLVLFAYTLKRN